MRAFFLICLTRMSGESVIERLAVDVLRMIGKMRAHRRRQISVGRIRHEAVS